MIDAYDPLRPWFVSNPDYNREDERRAVEAMLLIDDLTQQAMTGQADIDTLFDCLAEQEIDPLQWADDAVAGMERIVDAGIVFVSDETGLFLPQGIRHV
ncbi:hypothetical protein VB780_07210 [Leptolyngbya sp. CCNP1308]|uniref:hypothetical protein n=1 Tax=Leptolyngbya sp. CCNP1308 TaxID=3110255 RepID=UPI002B21B175|nr:hypothetical protein [Leptolyngbya sp. CCNP1308]MEA5448350.1 hypothetical protein [Leptolyngbya sp. CCNP1308]